MPCGKTVRAVQITGTPKVCPYLCVHLPLRVHEGQHAVVVEAVLLQQVDDVEAVLTASTCVGHCKEEPLRVPACVDVWLQD